MKWLLYVLLLSNGLFLAWQLHFPSNPPEIDEVTPVSGASEPNLALMSEAKEGVRSNQSILATASQPNIHLGVRNTHPSDVATLPKGDIEDVSDHGGPAPLRNQLTTTCSEIKGIESEVVAERLAKAFRNIGAKVEVQQQHSERKRYGVLIAPLRQSHTTKSLMAKLERAGFRDYYLIKTGDYQNMISLGVFSTPDAAERRVEQVSRLNLKPQVVEVVLPVKQYGVRVHSDHPQARWPKDVDLPTNPVSCE